MKVSLPSSSEKSNQIMWLAADQWPDQAQTIGKSGDSPVWSLLGNGSETMIYISPEVGGTEVYRNAGAQVYRHLTTIKLKYLTAQSAQEPTPFELAFYEGFILAGYQYSALKSERGTEFELNFVEVNASIDRMVKDCEIIGQVRDWVNAPYSHMKVADFCQLGQQLSGDGISVKVLEKQQLKALKMGGILGVNQGSVDPPAMLVMEYFPERSEGQAPVVLVGKGVMYDTGGLSLKPTAGSMDIMKCDMAGGAAVLGALKLVASHRLARPVVGLIPLTDNRPGGDAICPGDVLTMGNGMTVEVMNTDAEGRLILADALHYAKRYNPDLVVDIATLTGSAIRAIGQHGAVCMGTADDEIFKELIDLGETVGERVVRFPFWSQYDEELKSDVADIKNLGGPYAGCITAGKFLSHFVADKTEVQPWIHLDIAGPAFIDKPIGHWTKGGTGFGAKLLFELCLKSESWKK